MRGLNMGRRVAALAALAAAQTTISTMNATTTGLRRSTLPRTAPPYRTARGAARSVRPGRSASIPAVDLTTRGAGGYAG